MSENDNIQVDQSNNSKSGIPLTVDKKPQLKIYGVVAFIVAIVIANVFFINKNQHSVKSASNETYNTKTIDPTMQSDTKNLSDDALVANSADIELKQKVEEEKAKDFIERLQAAQTIDSGGNNIQSSNSAMTSANTVGNNQNTTTEAVPSSDSNTAFLQSANDSQPDRSFAQKFAPQPYLIGQGKFIFGSLAVAINSDLPGQVTAVVSQNVYGEQGHHILIPRGSRLIGEYRSGLANNQSRLFVVWTRVIEPNGISVMIGSEGTDALGKAGLTGNVDYHFFARFGTATLISLIGAGASTVGVNPDDQFNSMSAYRQAAAQSLAQQSSSMLSQTANIPPTINVAQGQKIVVFVNKDLDFSRVYR